VDVHTQLREMIVMGELAPNSVLSQAAIARTLGVSRGPVREAFRRLQEQGLITAEPDQRTYVTGFDPSSLDSLYGARITLETLGAGLTAATRTSELSAELHELIEQMDQGVEEGGPAWRLAHRNFHAAVASGAGSIVAELTVSLAERSEPYYRLYGPDHTDAHRDHAEILAAIEAQDVALAQQRHARHVSRTALMVLSNMAPEYEPRAIRASLRAFHAVD
jgi:DNA-binding GntR family transcriptional regulator